MHEKITSAQNPKIQRIRRLITQKKARDEEAVFVIEGVRVVEEAFRQNALIESVFYAEPASARTAEILAQAEKNSVPVYETSGGLIDAITDTRNAQPLLSVVRKRDLPLPNELTFLLVLDAIHDPGNLGTIIRTAAAVGVDCVLLAPNCTDPSAPKVLRSTMGAQFSLPVYELNWDELRTFFANRPEITVYASALDSEAENFWDADLTGPIALIIGSEADGIGADAAALAQKNLYIPMTNRVESVNAAIASAILTYEVRRQRTL